MPATDGDLKRMYRDIGRAADAIRGADSILIISHIDADGITAGSIASATVDRLGKTRRTVFEKKVTEDTVRMANTAEEDLVWICDLGSGSLSEFDGKDMVITDHHVPDTRRGKKGQLSLDDFSAIHHINPHCYGMDGSYEVCGAGMTYLVSRAVDPANIDLAHLGVVGACGDFQDVDAHRLVSLNRTVLSDAESCGSVVSDTDLRLFGRETRPLVHFLQYCNDPRIPGITDDGQGCVSFLDSQDIPLREGSRNRVWNDLSWDEKHRAISALLELVEPEDRDGVYGEVYNLPRLKARTGLRDAKEYATILNSCGRYDDAETGMRICLGDMGALKDAEENRGEHRRQISSAMAYVKKNRLIRERRFLQYFEAGSEIRETVVGIVAGMLLNSGDVRSDLPMLAFADADDGLKVSARADRSLVDRGLNLSAVMKTAAELVGGFGGGHSVAAGATIPPEKKEEFLGIAEDLISSQVI